MGALRATHQLTNLDQAGFTGKMNWQKFEPHFQARMRSVCEEHPDPAHDYAHVERVVANAMALAKEENADLDVVVPAAYLHDLIWVAKNDPRRTQASKLSANAAEVFLRELNFPDEKIPAIAHAIEAHSFSAAIPTKSLEAGIVQDADRLDALGAIGIARCFVVGGMMARSIPDGVAHFDEKLFKLKDMMKTKAGKDEAERRSEFMRKFLGQLSQETTL